MPNRQPTNLQSGRCRQPLNRTVQFILLLLAFSHLNSAAQQAAPAPPAPTNTTPPAALVTFYSNYVSLEGGLPKQKGAAFKGKLFSDDEQIASMEPGRFLTISFIPRHYTFTANSWMFKTPNGGAHLEIDLIAGEHYFIETASRMLPMPSYFSIKKVTCTQAIKDNAHDEPLQPNHILESVAPFVVAETNFPTCP